MRAGCYRRTVRATITLASLTLGASVLASAGTARAQVGAASAAPRSAAAPTAISPSPASVPPGVVQPNPEGGGVAQAQVHLQRALQHFRDRQYTEAIHEFELANAAAPSADFWFNIARCHELLTQYDAAVDFYRRYLRDKVDPPDRQHVEQHIVELQRLGEQARLASHRHTAESNLGLELTPPVAGAALSVGDHVVGHGTLPSPLVLPPGTYPVRVSAAGMQDWRASVRVRQGETVTAFVGLQPATLYRTRSGGHIGSYVLGAASLVAFGAGLVLGVNAATMAACTGDPAASSADQCPRRDMAGFADLAYGVGAGLLLTTAIVYFIENGLSHTERVRPRSATSARPLPFLSQE